MSVTITGDEPGRNQIRRIKFNWTSDSGGDALSSKTRYAYNGRVIGLITNPDGIAIPSDNYKVELLDDDGYDCLAGAGAARDTANTEYVVDKNLFGCIVNSNLRFQVSAAGAEKSGIAYVDIQL